VLSRIFGRKKDRETEVEEKYSGVYGRSFKICADLQMLIRVMKSRLL
jgi:hypothetical protein